jgi:hypothetical protein
VQVGLITFRRVVRCGAVRCVSRRVRAEAVGELRVALMLVLVFSFPLRVI